GRGGRGTGAVPRRAHGDRPLPERSRSRGLRRDPRPPRLRRTERPTPDLRPAAAVARRHRDVGRGLAALGGPPRPGRRGLSEIPRGLSERAFRARAGRATLLLHVPPRPRPGPEGADGMTGNILSRAASLLETEGDRS